MSHTAPDFTTIIITIIFLLILAGIGLFIKAKSGSIKKIIKKQEDLEVLHHMPLRSGYLAFVFKVGEENFFFVGHKSGRGSLTQINKGTSSNINYNNNDDHNSSLNKTKEKQRELSNNSSIQKKPLQHVNISDLLTAHKKGGTNA
jgi:hypothetical protein